MKVHSAQPRSPVVKTRPTFVYHPCHVLIDVWKTKAGNSCKEAYITPLYYDTSLRQFQL